MNPTEPSPKTAAATCAITVRCSSPWKPTRSSECSATWTSEISASAVTPVNIATAINPISSSVAAALRLLGARNAGTPLLIASTPVRAVQPEENARIARNINASPVNWSSATIS
jgi:hypothetical protein